MKTIGTFFLLLLVVFHVTWTEVIEPRLIYAKNNMGLVLYGTVLLAGVFGSVNCLLNKVKEFAGV